MTEQETTFTAHEHSTIINEAGVIFIGYPNGWGTRFEAKAAIAHAEYILAQKERLQQLQQSLEQTWREVALEIKQRFEKGEGGDDTSFADASESEIYSLLETLSGKDASRYHYVREPEGLAGRWYRSLWDEQGESISYEQQWTPFIRLCQELQAKSEEGDTEAPYDDRTAPRDTDRFRYE